MWPSTQDWVSALYIIVPTYCTNGAPVLFGGGLPIDLGKVLPDGQRVFGGHKTVRGFLAGLIVGAIVGVAGYYFFWKNLLTISLLASLGALVGDLVGAFLKRRMKIRPGDPLPGVDQLDFVLGAVLFVFPFYELSLTSVLIVLLVTPPIHLLANMGAHSLRLKPTHW